MAGQSISDCLFDQADGPERRAPSFYQLTVEPSRLRVRSRGESPGDEATYRHDALRHRMTQGGYSPYEISSAALNGYQSRHNCLYWTGGEFLSLGAGAHGFVKTDDGGIRWSNILHPEKYMSHALRGLLPQAEERCLDHLECREDRIMMGLRMDAGIRADSELRAAWSWGRAISLEGS